MFNFGGKKQSEATPGVNTQPSKRLVVQVGTMGWTATMLDADGSPKGQPLHGDAGLLESHGQERVEKIIQQAMEDLSKGMLKEADAIYLLLEDNSVVFSDSKQEGLRAASDVVARMFGQRMLNAPTTQSVTFGYAPFGPDPESRQSGDEESSSDDQKSTVSRRPSIYAFADVRHIRSVLSLFDISALKIFTLTPAVYPILRRAALRPDETYGALLFGSHETTIVLAHHDHHGVMVRSSPVGTIALAQSVSEKAGIGLADALENLSKRDLLVKITTEPSAEHSLTTNPYQAGLETGLRQLYVDIQESLDYFMSQRVCGKPLQLECFGDISRINGLDRWLTKNLQLEMVPPGQNLLHLFAECCATDECNLLRGAETSLISVGKVKYSFTKSGFVKTSALATQAQGAEAVKARAGQRRHGEGGSRTRRRGGHAETQQAGGLFQSFLAKLRGSQKDAPVTSEEGAETAHADLRVGALAFAALAGLLLYWGYEQYLVQKKFYRAAVSSYLTARDTNTNQIKAAGGGRLGLVGNANEEINKVLWTEKFIALSTAMNQHIWLTDLYLSSAQMEMAGAKVETKKLVMEGAVLPSYDGHIGRMTEFLRDLSDSDQNTFMSDFRQITFRGSVLDHHDDIVRFGFEAWYDRNKRIEEQKRKIESGDMSGNLDAIQESTKAKENALRPKLK